MFLFILALNIYFRFFIFLLYPDNIWHWRIPAQGLLNDVVAAALFTLIFKLIFLIRGFKHTKEALFSTVCFGWIVLNYLNYEFAANFNSLLPLSWFSEVQYIADMGFKDIVTDLISFKFLLLIILPTSAVAWITKTFPAHILGSSKRWIAFILFIGVLAQSTTLYPDIQPRRDSIVQSHIFKFWYYKSKQKKLPKVRTKPLSDFSDMFKTVILETPQTEDLSAPVVTGRQPNVVLIMLESFRAFEVGALGSTIGATPNFDRYAKQGILFSNLYSSSHLTKNGQWSILCGSHKHKGGAVLTDYRDHGTICFPDILAEKGYDNWWFHGQSAAYDNQGYFMNRHQVPHIMDRLTFPREAEVLGWGLADLDLMKHALNHQQKAREPFFWIIQSQSNHHPFHAPKEFQKENRFVKRVNNYVNTIRYTDYTLGYFLDHFRQTPEGKNSLIIISADHGTGVGLSSNKKHTTHEILLKYRVPLLILYPENQPIQPKTITTLGGQPDILPTMLDILNIESPFPYIGKSLIRDYKYRYAKGMVKGEWLIANQNMYFTLPQKKKLNFNQIRQEILPNDEKWFSLSEEIDDVQDWIIQQKKPNVIVSGLKEKGWITPSQFKMKQHQ